MEVRNRVIGASIRADMKSLAIEAYRLQTEMSPELKGFNSPAFVEKSIRDTEYSLLYLSNAISASSPKLFVNYVEWFVELAKSIKIPVKYLQGSFECIFEAIKQRYDEGTAEVVEAYVRGGLGYIVKLANEQKTPSQSTHVLSVYRDMYIKHLLSGNRVAANELVQDLVVREHSIQDIYMEIFHEGQHEIGRMWMANKITIAEEHYCTAATQLIMGQLYPLIFATPKNDYVFVGACVGGELHELGVRMVSDFLELDGWNTYYLGANTPNQSIVESIVKENADVVGISVTMTFHIDEAQTLIEAIRADARCAGVKIMVGGYPFIVDDCLWQTLGADGCAINAREALVIAQKLIAKEFSDERC